MSPTQDPPAGWGKPANSRKWHYFEDARSICTRWLFTGALEPDTGEPNPDDCAGCRRALERKKAKEKAS